MDIALYEVVQVELVGESRRRNASVEVYQLLRLVVLFLPIMVSTQ